MRRESSAHEPESIARPSIDVPHVALPRDAPLRPRDCGWPDDATLAFADWADPRRLLLGNIGEVQPGRVFVIVSADRIPVISFGPGDAQLPDSRQACAFDGTGYSVTAIPDDWLAP